MRTWIADMDMQRYHNSVAVACGIYQIQDGVSLDHMTNAEYKKAILECYRKALEEVPMPRENP